LAQRHADRLHLQHAAEEEAPLGAFALALVGTGFARLQTGPPRNKLLKIVAVIC
jgi:hypothetical protein